MLRRVVVAVDVGAENADAVLACDRDDLVLQLDIAGLAEPGRDEDRARDTLLADLLERGRDELRRDREHCDVHCARYIGDARIGLAVQNLGRLRVDRVDLPRVTAVDQVLHHRVADLPGLVGRPDHGDRRRFHDPVHRGEDLVLAEPHRFLRRLRVDEDPDVDRGRALYRRQHRVQVHFGQLREVGHQFAQRDDHPRERGPVDRFRAAHAAEDFGGLDTVEHRQRVLFGRRREAERHVLENFHEHPAEAERDDLAERRIGDRADDDFLALGQHPLHLHPGDLRVGPVRLGVVHDRPEPGGGFVRGGQSDQDAARFGLVQDVRRHDLQHHREADLTRLRDGVFCGGGQSFGRRRDAVGFAHLPAFGRGQRCPSLGRYPREDLFDRGAPRFLRHQITPAPRRASSWAAS